VVAVGVNLAVVAFDFDDGEAAAGLILPLVVKGLAATGLLEELVVGGEVERISEILDLHGVHVGDAFPAEAVFEVALGEAGKGVEDAIGWETRLIFGEQLGGAEGAVLEAQAVGAGHEPGFELVPPVADHPSFAGREELGVECPVVEQDLMGLERWDFERCTGHGCSSVLSGAIRVPGFSWSENDGVCARPQPRATDGLYLIPFNPLLAAKY
jgi:hypothetical protein